MSHAICLSAVVKIYSGIAASWFVHTGCFSSCLIYKYQPGHLWDFIRLSKDCGILLDSKYYHHSSHLMLSLPDTLRIRLHDFIWFGKYHFLPWWWRQQVLERCCYTSSRPHGMKSQKTVIFTVTKKIALDSIEVILFWVLWFTLIPN